MELKYLIARYQSQYIIFILAPHEEQNLIQKLEENRCPLFITGRWSEDDLSQKRIQRWIRKVDRWVITAQPIESETLTAHLCNDHIGGKTVSDLDSFMLELEPKVPAHSSQFIHLLATKGVNRTLGLKLYTAFKYVAEPLIALALFLLLSPILFLVALGIKFTSPGPVIYSQERVGYRGRVFRIYKFRSMHVDAEKGTPRWAVASKNDPNLIPIGGFLRSSHLDELPQLWNIIRGDLSFIGPRPERPEFVKQLTEKFPLFRLRPLLKPGITGWAQIQQGYANTISDSLRKLELDLYYFIKYSPLLDIKIALRTIAVLFSGGTEEIKRNRTPEPLASQA